MPTTIENETLRVVVLAEYGARVASLIDKRSGRDWMAQGGVSANVGEEAVYSVGEAVGWDECFPTVSRWDAGATPWARRLRDHGDLWGRPWQIDALDAEKLSTSFAGTGFRFARTLRLEGPALIAEYAVANTGTAPLPFMWALHALLATRAGETMRLPGVDAVDAVYLGVAGQHLPRGQVDWAAGRADLPFPIAEVQPTSARFAAKLYASRLNAASVGGEGGWLDFTWTGVPDIGIWLTYGGWPQPGSDVHHVALEPTTAAVDHLGQAIERGNAVTLEPGQTHEWQVRLTLRPGEA